MKLTETLTTDHRTTTLDAATREEAASYLWVLAAKQFDMEYLRASEADSPENPKIRSNRDGTRIWTTGKDFHYTAEWNSDDKKGDK